jgi:hypothetical protein
MCTKTFVCLLCSLSLGLAGCEKRASTQPVSGKSQESAQVKLDVCELLEKGEIEAIQGSPVTETKSSQQPPGAFRVAQCFYTTAEFSKSVSLAVIGRDPDQPAGRSPKDFWKEKFGPYNGEKKKSNRETQPKEEESMPPKKIEGVGEEAFWSRNRFGGILYVLKGDAFMSIGVGGSDNEETKINKSKALAQKAIQRL